MTLNADLQKLEPGAIIELLELDMTLFGGSVLYFHPHNDGDLVFDGVTYSAWAIRASGFARTSGQPPTPKLEVGNIDGSIASLCMMYEDLVGATLTRRQTLKQYMDAVNFPGGVNPTADPTQEFPQEIWYIERKAEETHLQVTFELSSAMDFGNVQLPRRQIIANFCQWKATGGYRGPYCGYAGGPVAKVDDTPTSDPLLDMCSGKVTGCKLRFGESGKLPYGGFPAAGLIRI